MPLEDLGKFRKAVFSDSDLMAKVKQVGSALELIDLAKQNGFEISLEELEKFELNWSEATETELTEAELEQVAGGGAFLSLFRCGGGDKPFTGTDCLGGNCTPTCPTQKIWGCTDPPDPGGPLGPTVPNPNIKS